jgi:hypothetical protein
MSSITRAKPDWSVIALEMVVGGVLAFKIAALRFGLPTFATSPAAPWAAVVVVGLLAIAALMSWRGAIARRLPFGPLRQLASRVRRTGAGTIIASSIAGGAFAFLAIRIDIARVASHLSGDEAVMVLLADPLIRLEAAICRWVGNPGSIAFVNGLGIGLWTTLFGAAVAMTVVCARRATR